MDKKDTTKPLATGDADGALKTPPQEPSLGHQAFDVFKNFLIRDLVKEKKKLQDENEKLAPVGEIINSTITVILAGKEYLFDLRNGCRKGNCFCFPILDADTILLKDLAGPALFSGLLGSDDESPPQAFSQESGLLVALGKIELGSLSLLSGFEGGKVVAKRMFDDKSGEKKDPYLYIYPSSKALVGGRLANVSEEDLSDDLEFFNQQASARLMFGVPAGIRNENNVSFTMDLVTILMTPELEDTVDVLLQHHENDLLEAPEVILSNLVAEVCEDDKSFSQKVEEYMVQKVDNLKLMSVRERLGTIDICYQGGSRRLSLDQCKLMKGSGSGISAMVDFPPDPEGLERIKFSQLCDMRMTMSGFDLSTKNAPRFPQFSRHNTSVIIIPVGPEAKVIGLVQLVGVEGGWRNFSFPGNRDPFSALERSLNGYIGLPDKVMFRFLCVELDCSRPSSRIVRTLKVLGKWQGDAQNNPEELEDSSLDCAKNYDSS